MAKIRMINSLKPGTQYNYSLVDNQRRMSSMTFQNPKIGQSFPKSSKEEANVEVEGGETVVGDSNGDGIIDLFNFNGPSHGKGGIPVKLPKDSFIFSEHLKLKDNDVLKDVFNVSSSKGISFGKLSKKFDLNTHTNTLSNKDADPLSKRTAQLMIDKNTKQLGALALLQEAQKGFPDGVPDISQHVMSGFDITPEEVSEAANKIQLAKCGGKIKKEDGGFVDYVKTNMPDIYKVYDKAIKNKDVGYIDKVITELEDYDADGIGFPLLNNDQTNLNKVVFELKNYKDKLTQEESKTNYKSDYDTLMKNLQYQYNKADDLGKIKVKKDIEYLKYYSTPISTLPKKFDNGYILAGANNTQLHGNLFQSGFLDFKKDLIERYKMNTYNRYLEKGPAKVGAFQPGTSYTLPVEEKAKAEEAKKVKKAKEAPPVKKKKTELDLFIEEMNLI